MVLTLGCIIVQLTQKGKEIKGTTKMDSRIWILEGEISDSGYIYGIYYAESIHDKGVGNFFLEFTNDGNLEGLWSGYDSINKKIVSGRYLFKKIPRIVISKVSEKSLPTILHIADKQLGNDYINANDFMQDDFLKFQASIDNKIVGFITSKEITIEEYADKYCITKKSLKNHNIILLHPGPVNRNIDISDEVLKDPRCKVLEQVKNGVAIRMAIMEKMIC